MGHGIKRLIALGLSMIMVASLAACGSGDDIAVTGSTASAGEQEMIGKGKKIALLTDVAGTQVFILNMIKGFQETAERYGFELIVSECADGPAFEENGRALVQEGVDLIVGGGWQATDTMGKLATEFPDKAQYALIDSEVDASIKNVKCISYREQEGAYLIGQLAALVTKDEDNSTFGAVHVNEGAGSFKWRWGYMEGIKSVRKGKSANFVFNYVGSYNDPAKAKEFALQQSAAGCKFINAAAAGGDKGVFEAAKDKHFYTSGQDVDLTTPDNPWVVSSQIKDTRQTVINLINEYFSGNWNTDNEIWGVKDGVIGAVYVTHESLNPRNPQFSDEDLDILKKTVEDIKSGKLDLTKIPEESAYKQ